MKLKIKKYNLSGQIYLFALLVYAYANILLSTSQFGYVIPTTVLLMFYWFVDFLLLVKIFLEKNRKQYGKIIIITCLVIITGMITKDNNYVCMLLLMCSSYDVDFDDILKTLRFVIISSIIVVLGSYFGGIIGETTVRRGGAIRHSLGFKYVNSIDSLFQHVMVICLYFRWKQKKNNENKTSLMLVLAFALGAILIYKLSLSRTTMIISLSFCVLYGLFDIKSRFTSRKRNNKLKKILSLIYFPVCVIMSCVLPMLLPESQFLSNLDILLTGRIGLAYRALNTYHFRLFGQSIIWVGSQAVATGQFSAAQYNYVDNGYLQIGLQFGVLILILICVAYSFLFYCMVEENNTFICIWVLLVGVESLVNPVLLSVTSNALTIYAVQYFVKKRYSLHYGIKVSKE